VNAIKTIPSSDTTVGRRIHDMAQYDVEQIIIQRTLKLPKDLQFKLMIGWLFLMKPSCLYTFGTFILRKGLSLFVFGHLQNF
jgi:hypothetical protein